MLLVSRLPDHRPEIFLSLQGEGMSLGLPSVFLRLSTCNLHCVWCDTPYTWDWKKYDPERESVSLTEDQVEKEIESLACPNLVVTGGEPLLQQEALARLLPRLKEKGRRIELETNGTILPSPEMQGLADQWNVSPKLKNSGHDKRQALVGPALKFFSAEPRAWFKFVVTRERDLQEVEDILKTFGLPRERTLLMPEGTDAPTLEERGAWLAEKCRDLGFRFSPRLQILLWGNRRAT